MSVHREPERLTLQEERLDLPVTEQDVVVLQQAEGRAHRVQQQGDDNDKWVTRVLRLGQSQVKQR